MKKNLFSLLFSILIQYPQTVWDIAILSAAKGYLKTLKALRHFYVLLIQVAISVFLLISGLLILNVSLFLALFLLAPWSDTVKVLIVFSIGILEFCGSLLWLRCIFSEKKWMKTAKQNAFVDKVIKKYYPLGPM
jgi:hypothetical protein